MLSDVTYSGFEEGKQHLQFSVIRDRLSAVLFGSHLELFSYLEVQLLFSLNLSTLRYLSICSSDLILTAYRNSMGFQSDRFYLRVFCSSTQD